MLIVTSSYFSTKCDKALHITHPDDKKSITVLNGMKAVKCMTSACIQAGGHILTDARFDEFDFVMVHGCSDKNLKDYLHRLMPYRDRFINLVLNKDKYLIFVDNTIHLIGEKVMFIPRSGNAFINDLAKTLDIDVETEGLDLTKARFDYDIDIQNINDKYFRTLNYLSKQFPIYIMDAKGMMFASNPPKVIRGKIFSLINEELKQITGKETISEELLKSDLMSSKRLRPIRAIYKKEEEEESLELDEVENENES